ncbi:hypothetical protein LAZ67_10000046, partial [Cordylochernes scorpioides]
MDQRTCIKFCVKNEIKCANAFRMLTVAYGEATLDRNNVYRLYKMFSEGREDVNDEERAGRPSTSTTDEKINEVEKMILDNRRITVREVAEDLNISIGSCHSIFINDLGMRRVAAKFVPKLLNCDQKQHRMNIANEMLDSVRDDPNLLQRVITGDEAWVYGYDVETKAQSSQWKLLPHEPRPKKARQVRSNVKVLLTVFFDCRGVMHHEFLPQGRTVNKEYYLQVMRNLREAIRQKRPDLWKNKNWLLHHPAHTSLLVRDFLAKNNTLMMPQPPYSPDLAPCDFFLFPKLKRPMKGRRYATLDEIKTASKEELKKILKNDFLKCFEDWKKPLAQPERLSSKSQTSAELSAKITFQKNSSEENQESSRLANLPAGKEYANPAAARDVTAPPTAALNSATTASPASLNWADSEMVEVDDNESFILVKGKKRRLTSTPEHAAGQPGRPAKKPSPQQRKRPTGPRTVPPQEIKATRANIADAKARQATTNHENYIFVELCPDIPDYSYLRAIGDLVGGPKKHHPLWQDERPPHRGPREQEPCEPFGGGGPEHRGNTSQEDATIVQALRKYGDITSIAPIMIKMGEFAFSDGRREAFILLHEGVRLETLPARLTIQSKGDTLSAFLSFGIKCSKCGSQGHRRASCPSLARRNFDAPKRVTPLPRFRLLLLLPPCLSELVTNTRPAPPPSRDIIIGFTIASINARGLATRNKSLSLCHLLRQHRVDIALVQETNTHHLDGAQDLCLGYDAITAPPDAISGSGLACIYAPGVTVSQHRILWPGHIVLAAFNLHGQEMTVINVHLSHDQRERIEQLRVIEAAAVEEEEEAWVLGDFNIRDDRNRDSISMAALGALCESAALLDAAPEFDAAHLPTRVAAHGDLIEKQSPRQDPRSGALSGAAPYQPRVAATLRSGLAQEHMNNYLVDIAEEISMLDAPQLWDRWTLIKAGILAEARSLHDPRHHDRDDSYIGRAQRYIRVQLEASSTNADYPSLSDLARLTRHRRPAVTTIRDENGEVIEGPVLRRKALDIFRPRFARPSCDPAEYAAFIGATTTTPIELGEEDPLHRAEVSEAEVAAAIRRLPRGRAPGWDGLPCEVLSTFEEFFAVALRRVLAESQLRGALPPSMRRSEICLVPKARGGDRGLDGYRPISLPSADYRVIGSILLGRLRPHLPTLVPECQTYAVPGRSPSWNIARVTDAVEEATARGTPLAAVSVDLQSAFDSLDRGYLTSLLVSHLRLPPAFVGWILLLYAGADATIRVGGFQIVAFKLLNGVRQGCALSAALFSIATGPLLRRLETILGVGNVIAYADDIVLLIHRDEQFARAAAIFESFHRASGIAVLGTRIATRSSVVQREQHLLALLESACRRTTPFTRGLSLVGRARAANSLVLSTIQHHLHAYLPEASIISKLQARVARFIWGPDHTAWLASGILARPVVTGGLGLIDIGTQLHLACLKGVQVALRGGRNGFSWLVTSEAWLRPPPDGTTLQPRRLRLLKLWEETSGVLSLDHRAAPTTQLLDLPIIGGFRFLRPPNLLAPSRWVGARVRDLGDDDHHTIVTLHPTRSALADAAALAAFCRRIVAENIQASYRVPSLAEAVVLRGTTKPLARITTRSARRALDRPRLAALPIHRLLARWTPTVDVPPRVDWTSLRRGALSGHNADVALRLALHALPHPDHPASAGPSCPACCSSDGSLGHRYWGCITIRPLILEAFNIIGRPPDLQAWIFGTGLEQDDNSILSSAKSRVYRHFIQFPKLSLGSAQYVMTVPKAVTWPRDYLRSWCGSGWTGGESRVQKTQGILNGDHTSRISRPTTNPTVDVEISVRTVGACSEAVSSLL